MTVSKLDHLPTLPSLLVGPQIPLIHRDISWLQFNERVLDEARAPSANPLLERVKFLSISASNLDEFFMVRFRSLQKKATRKAATSSPVFTQRRRDEIRANLLEDIAQFGVDQIEVLDSLVTELDGVGIHLVLRARGNAEDRALARKIFDTNVLKHLPAPERFHSNHLHHMENLQMGIYFPEGVWLSIPKTLPLVYATMDPQSPKQASFFFLDDLLLTFLGESISLTGTPGMVRLTRDSDFTADLEDQDPVSIPDIVRRNVRKRDTGIPVRIQYRGELDPKFIARTMRVLRLGSNQLLPAATTLCPHGLWTVVRAAPTLLPQQEALSYPSRPQSLPKPFRSNGHLFEKVLKHDYLLHHPYDAFDAFEEWLRTACMDKKVEMIELTIYRSNAKSALIDALKKAARKKKIRVFIELRARFDELNNLTLADELREAGVEVYFGFGSLKLHAKIALISRRESDQMVRTYTHLSTGNYNPETARQYTDLAILTANAEIGRDARIFFDAIIARRAPRGFKRLVSAPDQLHRKLLQHILIETKAAQKGQKTRIIAKVNALVDERVIAALYEASQSGVPIDLIVRGACSLVPGVTKLSRSIRVISIVDRFLEHSRLYFFESQRALYLSSADLMPRNLYSRLEIAFPILDNRIYDFIREVIFPTYLGDNVKARELTQQGAWKKRPKSFLLPMLRAQFFFDELARKEYQGTPLFER